jgi:hypothetical protein
MHAMVFKLESQGSRLGDEEATDDEVNFGGIELDAPISR